MPHLTPGQTGGAIIALIALLPAPFSSRMERKGHFPTQSTLPQEAFHLLHDSLRRYARHAGQVAAMAWLLAKRGAWAAIQIFLLYGPLRA